MDDNRSFVRRIVVILVAVVLIGAIIAVIINSVNQKNATKEKAMQAFANAMQGFDPAEKLEELSKKLDAIVEENRLKSEQALELLQKARDAIEKGDYEEAERILKEISKE